VCLQARPSSIKKNCPACFASKFMVETKLRPQQKKEEMGGSGVHSSSSSSSSSYLHYCARFGLKMPTLRWVANVKGSSWLLVNVLFRLLLVWRDFLSCSHRRKAYQQHHHLHTQFLTVSFFSSSVIY
jgi:hypothetical protein